LELSFPLLRLLAGIVFLLAGLFAYYHVPLGALGIVLVVAGIVIIAIPLAGHRPQGGDVALFVIALIAMAASASATSFEGTNYVGTGIAVYSASASSLHATAVDLSVSANLGSISIQSSTNSDLGYKVVFTTTSVFGIFPFAYNYSVTNMTIGGTLFLNATARAASISITLGPEYFRNIVASSNTGSVDLEWSTNETLGSVVLSSNTGSVDANVATSGIRELSLSTNTGSVSLSSDYLVPATARVPITLSTDTGSVSFDVRIPLTSGMSIQASNSLGSISHDLAGFAISQSSNNQLSATYGDLNTANSFVVIVSASTGSVSLSVHTF
jgi:hypothetical protein